MQHESKMKSQYYTVQGKNLHAWVGGEGRALLLLHAGYGDAEFSWKYVWEQLAESFKVIAPDMPGFGESEEVESQNASDVVALLANCIQQITSEKLIVVGNSFGGGIAYRFAQEHPKLVSRLVLVNGTNMQDIPEWLRNILKWPVASQAFARLGENWFYSDSALENAFNHVEKLPATFRYALEKNARRHSEVSSGIWINTNPNSVRVKAPISLIWGADDKMVPLTVAEKFKTKYPSATLCPIPHARHMPEFEQPAHFVAALTQEAL